MLKSEKLVHHLNQIKGLSVGIEVDSELHTLRILTSKDIRLDAIAIYGIDGSIKFENVQSNESVLNIKKLPEGNYTVLISAEDQVLVKQIMVA